MRLSVLAGCCAPLSGLHQSKYHLVEYPRSAPRSSGELDLFSLPKCFLLSLLVDSGGKKQQVNGQDRSHEQWNHSE